MPLGYVLVGGKSTRMRRDKALLPWYHRRLFEHLAGLLQPHCGSVALLGADRPEFRGYRVIADAFPEMGPLAGILSALRDPGEDWRLLLSCDTPLVEDAPIQELVAAARDAMRTNVDIVLPQTPDGRLQPLCALWHRRVGVLLENHLCQIAANPQAPRSQLAVQRFVHSLNLLPIHFHNAESVRNINTMRDYLAALAQRHSPE